MSEKRLLFAVRSPAFTSHNSKGKPTFINFDKPYPSQDFTVMIWDDDRAEFGN